MAQWYVTSSGDRLITYYGTMEECEVYGSLEAVNQTMEAVKGEATKTNVLISLLIFGKIPFKCYEVKSLCCVI